MKPLSAKELNLSIEAVNQWKGSSLQDFYVSDRLLALHLYNKGELVWLFFWLHPRWPLLGLMPELKLGKAPSPLPLGLFLRANFKAARFEGIELRPSFGRVLEIHFNHNRSAEVRLFPQDLNVSFFCEKKSMSLNKPKALKAVDQTVDEISQAETSAVRSFDDLMVEVSSELNSKNQGKVPATEGQQLEKLFQQKKKKLEKAIEKVTDDITSKRQAPWREVGEWLMAHQSLQVPQKWQSFVDKEISFAKNLQSCFTKAKEIDAKLKGTEKRLLELKKEYEELSLADVKPKAKTSQQSLLRASDSKGRSFKLDAECEAYIGRSAADNLKLLRKARAWDLWMHMADHPSAHLILRKPKQRLLSPSELDQLGQWFLTETVGKKNLADGDKFQLVYAECRYVRPIRGDRVGRVTYQNEKKFYVKFSP